MPNPEPLEKTAFHITIEKGDATAISGDALVTALPESLNWRGSLNGAVLTAAGQRLDEFVLENVYRPKLGEVFAVPGFNLSATHLIMTICPVWEDDGMGSLDDRDLLNCYRKPLELAARMGLKRLVYGALGTGKNAFPPRRAARLALRGLRERWYPDLEGVKIVCNRDDVIAAFMNESLVS